jgi:Uma2 family endonuclease
MSKETDSLEKKRAYYLEKISKPYILVIDDDNEKIKVDVPLSNEVFVFSSLPQN